MPTDEEIRTVLADTLLDGMRVGQRTSARMIRRILSGEFGADREALLHQLANTLEADRPPAELLEGLPEGAGLS